MLSPWTQKGETPKEWAHRWKCSCQGSVSDECKVLREALAQAERVEVERLKALLEYERKLARAALEGRG